MGWLYGVLGLGSGPTAVACCRFVSRLRHAISGIRFSYSNQVPFWRLLCVFLRMEKRLLERLLCFQLKMFVWCTFCGILGCESLRLRSSFLVGDHYYSDFSGAEVQICPSNHLAYLMARNLTWFCASLGNRNQALGFSDSIPLHIGAMLDRRYSTTPDAQREYGNQFQTNRAITVVDDSIIAFVMPF